MTEGKVIRVLLVFTIPIFISNLFQQFYNVVDVAVFGHILGDNALAAVGATSSIYSLVIGFSMAMMLVLIAGRQLIYALTGSTDANVIGISMKYLYWNVPFYAVLNILLIMRNCLQALENKKLPVIASIVELIGKFAGAFLLSRMIGYLEICLTEPITWIVCVPIVLAGFVQKIKQISKI